MDTKVQRTWQKKGLCKEYVKLYKEIKTFKENNKKEKK